MEVEEAFGGLKARKAGEANEMGSCQGNCQQRLEDARSAFLNMHQVSFCTASKTNHLTIKFSGQDVSNGVCRNLAVESDQSSGRSTED